MNSEENKQPIKIVPKKIKIKSKDRHIFESLNLDVSFLRKKDESDRTRRTNSSDCNR